MEKQLIARGQVSIHSQDDLYLINQTVSEYIFSAENNGTISKAVSFTSTVKIMQGNVAVTNFNIGTITRPAGFSAITVNNTNKTINYSVAANTTTLADTGIISIPITINNETYYASFVWSKAKSGTSGSSGQDAYTINLSRNNYIVSTDKDGKIHTDVTTSTVITALKGKVAVTPVIGALPTVSGCSLSKSGTTVTIVFKTGTSLAENGVIDIPITVDGKSFVVSFAYAKAKTGATGPAGADGNMLDWVNDWNSNKTVIDSYSVITPKIFAGVKNSNGTISGIAIGKFSLSTINASGQVASEIVNGIYGFKDGYKTFFIDHAGNVQLGNNNQSIKYNSSTGKIEFGSEVSLNWTNAANNALTSAKSYADTKKTEAINAAATDATAKSNNAKNDAIAAAATDATNKVNALTDSIADAKKAGTDARAIADAITTKANDEKWTTKMTYIDANGIFTGTLSANTVNAVKINASQITAGTIDVARLNVSALKSELITAANINALTLNVTKGKIGGWSIDSDSIFRGTKNNTASAFTGASGAITIGSNGIRGFKWRFDATGAGSLAGGNISWDAAGNVTFSASVSLNWTNLISKIETALGGSSYPKLTKIDANGIYTGTLTATQITAGTLNADRIASGSIKAVKLDAASIKADIINVGYINGLSCTFIQGKIGGWTIGSDNISIGSLNVVGQTPIQIRSVSSGSGYIYNGQFKPLGITLSWYQSSNAGHLVFGQVMATGNTIKTGFFGIQMMAWDNTEYFCISANITKSGAKEVYNKIAGWNFDNDSIYRGTKNNAAGSNTSASGGITIGSNGIRGFKWRLDSTGAGAIAGGNISWDAAGNVTFSSSVSLNWTTPISKIETALGGSSYTKLTKIDANGIYTGTLTAIQINVTGIDASKITVGTLSVDRLAAGSITAAKLNVANVQASVVTAAAVNGLTCAFTKGTIGGWTINASSIYNSNLVISNGSRRIVVFGPDSSISAGTRTQFYWNSNTDWGFLATNASGTSITRFGSSNNIAGWNIDTDSISRGTKNNTSGAYTSASGSITIGSNGIRGYKWRLDSTGAGAIAGGNISWDAAGNVSFASSVSLNWTNAANSAANGAKELALAMAFGKMLYRDPTFINGNNGINIYNNSSNGTVTITRASDSLAPNDNKMVLIIQNKGTSSPYCGGFHFGTGTTARRVLIARIVAKIPTGRDISYHSNSIGTGGVQKWLTPTAGTGDWAEYICKITCGTSGTFSSTCFFAITGSVGTASAPVEWRVAYATVFDQASNERFMTTIDANGIYTGTVKANQVLVDSALVVGGSSYNGSISVRDASNVVKVTLDRTGITAIGGKIGGWQINDRMIFAYSDDKTRRIVMRYNGYFYCIASDSSGAEIGSDYWALHPNGSANFGLGKIKFNADGSGYVANNNVRWDTAGNVTMTGTINATAGKIGGFEIGSGRIGSTASATGNGGGLALYNDFFRVGSSISYAMLGDDTFPASAGGSFKTTARITNTRVDSWFTNIGIYLDVKNARSNYGIHSNAAIMGPALISNKAKTIAFGSGSYSIDFSQYNIFFVYATTTCSVTLPTESQVADMFRLGTTLPSDFACIFTFIYNYNYGNNVTFNNIRDHNGNVINYKLGKGDSITVVCAKFPAFHYQTINHHS